MGDIREFGVILLDFYEKINFCWPYVLFLLPLESSIFPE
jgi:hypothetical protein